MMTTLGTIFSFIIVFGILVFVHEFGHFIMAKIVGIRVEVFSWGYGKKLFGLKKGDTDYRVSMLPLGGYVKFSGDDVFDQKRELAPHDFFAKKRWERFLVLFTGSFMNILFAIFLVFIISLIGVTVPEYTDKKPVIGWIEPGSPAEKSELKIDDEILSIDGKRTKTWNDVEITVGIKPKRQITLEIEREGEVRTVELMTESRTRLELGYAGFYPKILTRVDVIMAASPAEKAGLKTGDIILAINDETVYYPKSGEIIADSPGQELRFLIERDGEELVLPITPRLEGKVGKIGCYLGMKYEIRKYSFFSAISRSIKENAKLTFILFDFLGGLVSGEASARQIGGPIEIAKISYAFFQAGFIAMMSFIAFISLQLGIINLFPIPVFDGGQILVLSLEGLSRRDFSPKIKQVVMMIGFAIFIFLIVFVVLNDVARTLPNGWESFLFWK